MLRKLTTEVDLAAVAADAVADAGGVVDEVAAATEIRNNGCQ
jgi:hypothetical protein